LLRAQVPAAPAWAQPGSATHVQVAPPPDFHRPGRHFETPIGIFEGQSDIGGALVPGSASYEAATGQYTIRSAGYNVWYTRDEFRYLWKKMSGDVSLAAGIAFPDANGYSDRKAVLVIRQDLDDDSKEAIAAIHGLGMIHLAQRAEKGVRVTDMEYRIGGRGRPGGANPDSLVGVFAQRIGIEKHGDSFALFVSLEGEPMHQFGPPIKLNIDGPFYAGIGFCSHLRTRWIRLWSPASFWRTPPARSTRFQGAAKTTESQMRQIEITRPGPPDVLVVAEGPAPQVRDGEVLIAVRAAGMNRPDLLQRQGTYPPPAGASPLLGLEVAGEIVSAGAGVTDWHIGDRVCALLAGGGYAEYAAAPAVQCLPIPSPLDFVEAAAIPETFFTVWANVFELGRLRRGESFLVHGGSGGIGTAAIGLARAFGARVFSTAGSAAKCEACRTLGSEAAINYRETDFVEAVHGLTGGRGVDLILDMVGGSYTPRNLAALAPHGRLVQIAHLAGSAVQVDLRAVMVRRLTITGSTLRPRTTAEKGAIASALRENVWPLLESGAVSPVIDRVFPLAEAAAAHRYMESGGHIGKIVLFT
jgi:NADPH2:quinone reductase